MSVLHDSVTAEGWLCQNTLPNYCILEQVNGSEWPKPVKQARLCQARFADQIFRSEAEPRRATKARRLSID